MDKGIYNREESDEVLLEKIKGNGIGLRNYSFIKEFNQANKNLGAKTGRRAKLIRQAVVLAKMLIEEQAKELPDLDRQTIMNLMGSIYSKDEWRAYTKHDFYRLIRQLCGRHPALNFDMFRGIPFNETLESKSEVATIITEEDIVKVLETCPNLRTRALIALLYETGMRIGELLGIRFKDILKAGQYWKIKISGKTGTRDVFIVKSVCFLTDYMNSLESYKPDDYFWLIHKAFRRGNIRLTYAAAAKSIREAFADANLGHIKHNPHFFRHSRATLNANWMTDAQMCKFFGWELGSNQAATYVRMSGIDLKNAVLKQNGISVLEEAEKDKDETTISEKVSVWKTPKASEYAERSKEVLMQEELDKSIQLLMEIAKDPELMKRFEEFKNMEGRK